MIDLKQKFALLDGRIDGEKLLDALDRVTWYNGLAEQILEWKELPVEQTFTGERQIKHLYSSLDGEQLEVIWMIAVSLFGDYGTSPRSGWITDVEGFFAFVDRITTRYREWCVNFQTGEQGRKRDGENCDSCDNDVLRV